DAPLDERGVRPRVALVPHGLRREADERRESGRNSHMTEVVEDLEVSAVEAADVPVERDPTLGSVGIARAEKGRLAAEEAAHHSFHPKSRPSIAKSRSLCGRKNSRKRS